MTRFIVRTIVAALALPWLVVAAAPAADIAEIRPAVMISPGKLAPRHPLRDPTQAAPLLRQLIDPAKSSAKAAELPVVQLKGRILSGRQTGAAILEIDKRSFLLHAGSEITIPNGRSSAQTLRVVEVNAEMVRVEILPLGQTLILN